MKKFTGESENSLESSIRKGFSVPLGAVNLAWVKSPKLTPKNNIIMIDTSKAISDNVNSVLKNKHIALANSLGVLEDVNGNQIWDEEYPIISDVFLNDEENVFDTNTVLSLEGLPFVHVSRFFHVDYVGIAFDTLTEYVSDEIKVVDSGGKEYKDSDGNKLYKVYLVQPDNIITSDVSRNILYRVYIFLDIDPESQELYLRYNKGELSDNGVIKNQEVFYQEIINPRKYFDYLPEETDVIDQYNYKNKVYSSKPALKKEELIGTTTNSSFGWKYFVPKKAIPDPRIFQAFSWRIGCEFTEVRTNTNRQITNPSNPNYPIIKAGVVIPTNGNHDSTRANYLFYQLNITDYNTAGIKFINPLKSQSNTYNETEQQKATYWHVDIANDDFSKFDVLVFAPSVSFDLSPYLAKINDFTSSGGTFIIETSSVTEISNMMANVTFSSPLRMASESGSDYVQPLTVSLFDQTPEDKTDTFNKFSQWESWPPNISDIINNFGDIASVLKDGSVFSGWNLTTQEDLSELEIADGIKSETERISAYAAADHVKFQYINSFGENAFSTILKGTKNATEESVLLMIHQKHNNGGNLFISTSCIFEDHLLDTVSSINQSRTIFSSQQTPEIDNRILSQYNAYCSSFHLTAEMKLRLNIMLYSTLNKPSNNNENRFSVSDNRLSTIFTDWQSSWVIDGAVLSDEEISKYRFTLQAGSLTEPDPVWKRSLSTKSIKDLIDEKVKESDDTKYLADLTTRRYYLITTNPLVKVLVPDEIQQNDEPMAWTNAYSPQLKTVLHLGKYALKNEIVESSSNVDIKNQYPPRPFTFQSSLTSLKSSTINLSKTVTFSLSGSYEVEVPGDTIPGTEPQEREVILNWRSHGGNQIDTEAKRYQGGWPSPIGIETYTDENYYNKTPTNFPYMGLKGLLYHEDRQVIDTLVKLIPVLVKQEGYFTLGGITYEATIVPTLTNTIAKSFLTSGSEIGANGNIFQKIRAYSIMMRAVQIPSTMTITQAKAARQIKYSTFTTKEIHWVQSVAKSKVYSSKGLNVKRVQMILNELIKDRQLSGPQLKVDGVYGATTAAKVKAFQKLRKAYWIDGIVDSETWSLLGYSLVGLLDKGWVAPNDDLNNVAQTASAYIRLNSISDGSTDTGYVRQSWIAGNSPSSISETFKIKLTNKAKISKITITPWLADSETKTVTVDYLHVGDDVSLKDYRFSTGSPGILATSYTATSDQPLSIPIDPEVEADCVVIRLTQKEKAGWGKSRVLGLKEVSIHTFELTDGTDPIPGEPTKVTQTFTSNHTLQFAGNKRTWVIEPLHALQKDNNTIDDIAKLYKLDLDGIVTFANPDDGPLFDFRFVDSENIKVEVGPFTGVYPEDEYTYITEDKIGNNGSTVETLYRILSSKNFVITYNGIDNIIEQSTEYGPEIGNGRYSFYTKGLDGTVDNIEKAYGYVSNSDGVLLICDQNGNPFGFPGISSLNLSDDVDVQFLNLALNVSNVDQFTKVGFYDITKREFIFDAYGYSNISYYDYVRRGAQNVYIAVQTGYQLDVIGNLGTNVVSVSRPFSWMMPIYSVTLNNSSKIQINPMPENLTVDDVWYVPVKCGTFTRSLDIPSRQNKSLIGYLNRYQNTKVKAFYNIPESSKTVWSSLFGKPYVDIVGEIPEILDDFTIKLKFGNILNVKYPTENFQSQNSSPWRPVFTVYRRDDLFSPWREVPMSSIKDYNLYKGVIVFRNRITSNDSRLIKVDYTCERKEYNFKYDSSNNEYVNLNPYINVRPEWINTPLYIYMVPEYVYDYAGRIIEDSKTTSVVRITNSPYIFNQTDIEYDPTAIMLGVVYISTSFNIDDLVIIDTRKRGGGVYSNYEDKDMEKVEFEYNSFWDVVPSHVTAYQKGGFIIIRLPVELKEDFTTEAILQVIDRNIPAGVAYKVEDLQGNKWES